MPYAKAKDGTIARDLLTKEWTDWIDYWAVDFDYASRPETIYETVTQGDPLYRGTVPATIVPYNLKAAVIRAAFGVDDGAPPLVVVDWQTVNHGAAMWDIETA